MTAPKGLTPGMKPHYKVRVSGLPSALLHIASWTEPEPTFDSGRLVNVKRRHAGVHQLVSGERHQLALGGGVTTTNDTPPVLDATRDGVHLTFWCDHCRRLHYHGVCSGDPNCPANPYGRKPCTCPTGSGDGHRVAHCHDPASPYYDTGYVLREKAAP